MNVCIFGTSLNPPHISHSLILKELMSMNYDKVILLPTGIPNHKTISISDTHRKNMANILGTKYGVEVSLFEIENKIDYTYKTLQHFFKEYDQITLVIGADSLNTLKEWDYYDLFYNKIKFIIINRPGYNLEQDILKEIDYKLLDLSTVDISSTELRKNIIKEDLDIEIYDYIIKNNLYKD
ncbi:MAG: nicotinate-nicotinamide nucleotide adenylyltransferase [Mycoplasmatales bacterium]